MKLLFVLLISAKINRYVPNYIYKYNPEQDESIISHILVNTRRFKLLLITILKNYELNSKKKLQIYHLQKMLTLAHGCLESIKNGTECRTNYSHISSFLQHVINWNVIFTTTKIPKHFSTDKFYDGEIYVGLQIYTKIEYLFKTVDMSQVTKNFRPLRLLIMIHCNFFNKIYIKIKLIQSSKNEMVLRLEIFTNIIDFILQIKSKMYTDVQKQIFLLQLNEDGDEKCLYESILTKQDSKPHLFRAKHFLQSIASYHKEIKQINNVLEDVKSLFIINVYILKEPILRYLENKIEKVVLQVLARIKSEDDRYKDLKINLNIPKCNTKQKNAPNILLKRRFVL